MADNESNIGKLGQDDNGEITPATEQSGLITLKPPTWLQLKTELRRNGPKMARETAVWLGTMVIYGYATGIFGGRPDQEDPALLGLKMIGGIITCFTVTSLSDYLYDRYVSPRLRGSSKSLNLNA